MISFAMLWAYLVKNIDTNSALSIFLKAEKCNWFLTGYGVNIANCSLYLLGRAHLYVFAGGVAVGFPAPPLGLVGVLRLAHFQQAAAISSSWPAASRTSLSRCCLSNTDCRLSQKVTYLPRSSYLGRGWWPSLRSLPLVSVVHFSLVSLISGKHIPPSYRKRVDTT